MAAVLRSECRGSVITNVHRLTGKNAKRARMCFLYEKAQIRILSRRLYRPLLECLRELKYVVILFVDASVAAAEVTPAISHFVSPQVVTLAPTFVIFNHCSYVIQIAVHSGLLAHRNSSRSSAVCALIVHWGCLVASKLTYFRLCGRVLYYRSLLTRDFPWSTIRHSW